MALTDTARGSGPLLAAGFAVLNDHEKALSEDMVSRLEAPEGPHFLWLIRPGGNPMLAARGEKHRDHEFMSLGRVPISPRSGNPTSRLSHSMYVRVGFIGRSNRMRISLSGATSVAPSAGLTDTTFGRSGLP